MDIIQVTQGLIPVSPITIYGPSTLFASARLARSLTCSIILGMMDGNLTVLTIADPKKGKMNEYLKALPSRNKGKNLLANAGF